MGSKHPDVLRAPPAPETALTLAEMHIREWELMACCRRCSVRLRVSLPVMIRAYGPDAIWWGRRPPCPVWDCAGHLEYQARSIAGGTWRTLKDPAPPRVVELWKAKRQHQDRGPR